MTEEELQDLAVVTLGNTLIKSVGASLHLYSLSLHFHNS